MSFVTSSIGYEKNILIKNLIKKRPGTSEGNFRNQNLTGGAKAPQTPPTSSGGAFVVGWNVRRRAGPDDERPARRRTPRPTTWGGPGGREPPREILCWCSSPSYLYCRVQKQHCHLVSELQLCQHPCSSCTSLQP